MLSLGYFPKILLSRLSRQYLPHFATLTTAFLQRHIRQIYTDILI